MIVETALALGGALVTAMVGVPVVARLAQPEGWRRHAPPDPSIRRAADRPRQAFEPLDLGPDPMRWPSEVERASHGGSEPPWPSQTWDDPHFGAHWKRSRPASSAPGNAAAEAARPPEAPRAPEPALVVEDPRSVAPAPVADLDLPSLEEIQRMVATVGLAGTVQEIMERTGWDFRQAAQFLARARQQRR